MRWDSLFDDLEGQLEQELRAEEVGAHAEEERLRIGRLSLRDRLVAIHGGAECDEDRPIRIILTTGEHLTVRALSFGRDWFTAQLVGDARRPRQCVVPLASIATVVLSRAQVELSLGTTEGGAAEGESSLASRLTLPFLLRDLCRRRSAIDVRTTLGDVHGTIDRVGRDHFDLATHESGRVRRDAAVADYRTVPLQQLLLLLL